MNKELESYSVFSSQSRTVLVMAFKDRRSGLLGLLLLPSEKWG